MPLGPTPMVLTNNGVAPVFSRYDEQVTVALSSGRHHVLVHSSSISFAKQSDPSSSRIHIRDAILLCAASILRR